MSFSTYDKVNTDMRGPVYQGKRLPASMHADYYEWKGLQGALYLLNLMMDKAPKHASEQQPHNKQHFFDMILHHAQQRNDISAKYPQVNFWYVTVE